MRFLFVLKQKKNLDTFRGVLAKLCADGHTVVLALQDRDADRDQRLRDEFPDASFEVVACPDVRGDSWRGSAALMRSVRDWAHYLKPQYRGLSGLQRRTAEQLAKQFGLRADELPTALEPEPTARLHDLLERIEAAIPSDPLHQEFIERHTPDVVVVSPGLHFGTGQADFVKSARAIGVPVWMLLFSWDNLSTKGALHVAPDMMAVWNERQRQEASELHAFPPDRVVVVGAPRFDEFFRLRGVLSRDDFFAPLDMEAARPAVLYVCSSRFVADRELSFIRRWLAALRASANPLLRRCSLIVRPHPDVTLVEGDPGTEVRWPGMRGGVGVVQRPFDDPHALVLRTKYQTQQAFYECLHHAAAVVGLNTSAELEAGIAGRPVLTLLADDEAVQGQSSTLHFRYLLREHGGFVSCAPDLAAHMQQLGEVLAGAVDEGETRRFIGSFLRPHGDRSVSELLADVLVTRTPARRTWGPPSSGGPAALVAAAPDAARVASPEPGDESSDAVALPQAPLSEIRIGYPSATARVFATPGTRAKRGVLPLDPAMAEWLADEVRPGEVLYDIGAGIGAYSLVAATSRGALVVAFEAGYASFARLCDNLVLNGCNHSVIPLSIALGSRTGLFGLEYRRDAGDEAYTLGTTAWRARADRAERRYAQPVCAERLDDVIARHRLPQPHALRLAADRGTEAILEGAPTLLANPQLRSLVVQLRDAQQAETIAERLEAPGFVVRSNIAGHHERHTVWLVRRA
jgi:FkbM family methyltransferase